MDIASEDADFAREYVENNNWDVLIAFDEYWEAMHPESSNDELTPEDEGSPPRPMVAQGQAEPGGANGTGSPSSKVSSISAHMLDLFE